MKKTFPLQAPGKDDARVRDKIRQEVNRYVRRELRKPVPEGFAQWDFACKVGSSPEDARSYTIKEVGPAIDATAQAGAAQVYLEVVSMAAHRPPRN